MFKDRTNFPKMVDPLLQGHYPKRGLYQALAIAAMCVQEHPNMRPCTTDVVSALNYLANQNFDYQNPPQPKSRKNQSSFRSRAKKSDASRQTSLNESEHD